MSEKKGLAYKVKNFNLLTIFSAEGAVLIVIIVLVLAVFNYFNIFSPKFLSFLPHQVKNISKSIGNIDPNAPPTIGVASENKDYGLSVKAQNNQSLVAYLDKFKIWGKTYNSVKKDARPLKMILVLLTDNKGQTASFGDAGGNTLFSYSTTFVGNEMLIKIYLPDYVLQTSNVSQTFGNAFGYILSGISGSKASSTGALPVDTFLQNSFEIKKTGNISPTTSPIPIK